MQVSGGLGQRKKYRNAFECISEIYKRYGFRGFYRGLAANAARAAPQTGIEFAAFDMLSGLMKKQQVEYSISSIAKERNTNQGPIFVENNVNVSESVTSANRVTLERCYSR